MPEQEVGLSKDLKMTIAKVAALQSCATDPAHILIMTRNLMRWVRTGLVIKYGEIPDGWEKQLTECHDKWNAAQRVYGSNIEQWPAAMIACSDVADMMTIIAGVEDMLDYSVIDYNFTADMLHRMGAAIEKEHREGEDSTEML